jgi:hypothetical protein
MKLRNRDQLSPERRAALEAKLNQAAGPIIPIKAQSILEAGLEAIIDEGVLTLGIL